MKKAKCIEAYSARLKDIRSDLKDQIAMSIAKHALADKHNEKIKKLKKELDLQSYVFLFY